MLSAAEFGMLCHAAVVTSENKAEGCINLRQRDRFEVLVPGRGDLFFICSAPCPDCLTTESSSVTELLSPCGNEGLECVVPGPFASGSYTQPHQNLLPAMVQGTQRQQCGCRGPLPSRSLMQARGDSLLCSGSQGQQSRAHRHDYSDGQLTKWTRGYVQFSVLKHIPFPPIWHWGFHSRHTCSSPVHSELLSPHWSPLAQSLIPKE